MEGYNRFCMLSAEHSTDQQSNPHQVPLKDSLGALEQKLLGGDFDWSLIQPSPTLLKIRTDVMQRLHEENPDWDETLVAQTTARVETAWKAAHYDQLSEAYGESDERVVQLREDINFWKALLG